MQAPSGGNDPFYYLLKEACWKYNETDCVTLWKLYIYPLQTGVNTTISDSYNVYSYIYINNSYL